MDFTFITLLAVFGLQQATTIGIAAQGELITEKSGILNIGIEGSMLMSAFMAGIANVLFEPYLGTSAPMAALAAGALVGVLTNFFFAVLSTKMHVDQVIAGVGINIFGLGITYVLSALHVAGSTIDGTQPAFQVKPVFYVAIGSSKLALGISPLTLLMLVLPIATLLFLNRTKLGLHIRAAGENPKAAEAAGLGVARIRITATCLGGALLGVAGSYLSIDISPQFTPNVTAGVGFIAIAAVIAGAWKPYNTLAVSLIFGACLGLAYAPGVPTGPLKYLVTVLPYLITVAMLAIASRRLRSPAALALPYKKE